MTNAEQWLADLEAKAKAATPGPWQPGEILEIGTVRQANGHILADCRLQLDDGVKNSRFIAAANPVAVLRLVNMVRWLAEGCDERITQRAYDFTSPDMAKSELGNTYRRDRHGHGRNVDDA